MPRNSSGTYSLPETPFVPGTTIQSAPVNSDLSDIATALTTSLATTGVSTMTGPIKAASGTVSAPSITFSNSLGTGWFLSDTDEVTYAVNGVAAIVYETDRSVTFLNGLAPGNVANADGNFLDWYEEGTFTPVLRFNGSTTGITYTTQEGWYTRIGNLVFFQITIILSSNGSASGGATVSGLPYAADGNATVQLSLIQDIGMESGGVDPDGAADVFGFINDTETIVELLRRFLDTDDSFIMEQDGSVQFADTAAFCISGHYRV